MVRQRDVVMPHRGVTGAVVGSPALVTRLSIVESEEITLKLIIDCLYEVGTVNIINQKYQNKPMNRFLKAIARMSKPVLRAVALRWVKKNLPTLLTDWLEEKVSFKEE